MAINKFGIGIPYRYSKIKVYGETLSVLSSSNLALPASVEEGFSGVIDQTKHKEKDRKYQAELNLSFC